MPMPSPSCRKVNGSARLQQHVHVVEHRQRQLEARRHPEVGEEAREQARCGTSSARCRRPARGRPRRSPRWPARTSRAGRRRGAAGARLEQHVPRPGAAAPCTHSTRSSRGAAAPAAPSPAAGPQPQRASSLCLPAGAAIVCGAAPTARARRAAASRPAGWCRSIRRAGQPRAHRLEQLHHGGIDPGGIEGGLGVGVEREREGLFGAGEVLPGRQALGAQQVHLLEGGGLAAVHRRRVEHLERAVEVALVEELLALLQLRRVGASPPARPEPSATARRGTAWQTAWVTGFRTTPACTAQGKPFRAPARASPPRPARRHADLPRQRAEARALDLHLVLAHREIEQQRRAASAAPRRSTPAPSTARRRGW